VIGLINPGLFRVGDVLISGPRLDVRNFPRFAPEIFAQVRPRDPSMGKAFRKGVEQLTEEGVVQVFYPRTGMRYPILGAIGELQLEVFKYRIEHEYDVVIHLDRLGFERARWLRSVSDEVASYLPALVVDESGRLVALFRSEFEIGFMRDRYKDLELLEHPPTEEEKA
jgi:peptide chain release factor 3